MAIEPGPQFDGIPIDGFTPLENTDHTTMSSEEFDKFVDTVNMKHQCAYCGKKFSPEDHRVDGGWDHDYQHGKHLSEAHPDKHNYKEQEWDEIDNKNYRKGYTEWDLEE